MPDACTEYLNAWNTDPASEDLSIILAQLMVPGLRGDVEDYDGPLEWEGNMEPPHFDCNEHV